MKTTVVEMIDLKNIYMYKLQKKLDENDMIFTQTGLHRNKC